MPSLNSIAWKQVRQKVVKMSEKPEAVKRAQLLQIFVWGQAIGFVVMTIFLMYEDAPNILERADILLPLMLVLSAMTLSIPDLRIRIAMLISSAFLMGLILIVSFSTLFAAIAGVSLSFSIPDQLVTSGWQYTRTTSLITLAVFLIAFIANVTLSIQLQRIDRSQETTPEQT